MMRELDRPNVGLCLDAPLFKERQSDAYVTEAARACRRPRAADPLSAPGTSSRATTGVEQGPCPSFGGPVNYGTFLAELQRAGYDGYLVSEYCLPCVKDHRMGGIEDIDAAMVQSLRYMKSLRPVPQPV